MARCNELCTTDATGHCTVCQALTERARVALKTAAAVQRQQQQAAWLQRQRPELGTTLEQTRQRKDTAEGDRASYVARHAYSAALHEYTTAVVYTPVDEA